jgi:hypothetical protein
MNELVFENLTCLMGNGKEYSSSEEEAASTFEG